MQRKTDDDERPEPGFDLTMLQARLLLPDAPWQVVRDALLDAEEIALAEDVAEWYSLPAPNSWITCDVLMTSDYSGAGTVGEANQRSLKAALPSEEWVEEHGGSYSTQLWLLDNDSNRAIVEGLERNYPLYDDEEHSKVEMEWEEQAWADYGWIDLKRECRRYARHSEEWEEVIESMPDAERFELYRKAMEAANQYPTFEYSGACLPLDKIVSEFFDVTEALFRRRERRLENPDQMLLPFPNS